VLVLLVVATAATGIRLAGIAGALAAAVGFDFFLTEPYYALNIAGPDDIATAVLLLLVSGLVGEIALWGRRQVARASREQGYLDGVIGTAATAAAGRASTAQLTDQVARQITDVLQIDNARFDPATHYGRPTLGDDGTVSRNRHTLDAARRGLPTDATTALKVTSGGTVYGHYLFTSATKVARPSRNQPRVAVLLAEQVGAALATQTQQSGDPT
jgi:K+-sensing histidine kinase KdpD